MLTVASPPKPWERVRTGRSGSSLSSLPSMTTREAKSLPNLPIVPARPAIAASPPTSALPYTTTTPPNNTLSLYAPHAISDSTHTQHGDAALFKGALGRSEHGYGTNTIQSRTAYPSIHHPSLTQTVAAATQHTFSVVHDAVQAFTGVTQTVESTFTATHHAFFAILGIVEQLTRLRNTLEDALGSIGLVGWASAVVSGTPRSPMQAEFMEFVRSGRRPIQGLPTRPASKSRRKLFVVFLLAVVGTTYAMSRLLRILNERARQQLGPLVPSALSFARVLYPFTPVSSHELALRENEIVLIMGKLDPTTCMEVDPRLEVESEWWRGRTRDGREGWFPSKWVEILERKTK